MSICNFCIKVNQLNKVFTLAFKLTSSLDEQIILRRFLVKIKQTIINKHTYIRINKESKFIELSEKI